MLRIQGSGRGMLSMDYNFFVAQSRAAYDPHRYEIVRDQTLQTYLQYFKRNYAGRRLQRGVKVIRTRGLRVAGSALRDLCQAGRFHGSAERGNARGLSQGRFCTRCDTEVERGASVAIATTDGMLATGPPPCRHAGLPFFPPPSPASRVYASVPSDSR